MIEVYMYTYGRLREAKCSHCLIFIVTLVKKEEGDFKPRDKKFHQSKITQIQDRGKHIVYSIHV